MPSTCWKFGCCSFLLRSVLFFPDWELFALSANSQIFSDRTALK
jgi:hypothetical protein